MLKPPSSEEKVELFNSQSGKLEGYDCPECLNRGFSHILRDGNPVLVYCACQKIRRSLKRIEKSGLADRLEDFTFDRYEITHDWQRTAKSKALRFLYDNYGKWFCAFGASGAGKTHLCTAICGDFLSTGKEVIYAEWRKISVKLKAMVNDAEDYENEFNKYLFAEVLYIDDLFKTRAGDKPTDADVRLAFDLINARYNDRSLITIISSECDMYRLLDIDEAIGGRIYERSKEYLIEFTGTDKNQRLSQ